MCIFKETDLLVSNFLQEADAFITRQKRFDRTMKKLEKKKPKSEKKKYTNQ